MNKILLILLASLFTTQLISQNCGTPENEHWLEDWEQRGGRKYLKQGYIRPRNTIFIPIHYHIVRQSNGANGFPLSYLFKMHCELNQRYASTGIQFTLDTFSYIDSDTYFNLDQASNGSDAESMAMSLAYNTLNHCNIYLVNQPLPGNCGYTYRPTGGLPSSRSSIYLAASYGNYTCTQPTSTTLTHEMGHWLDLPHTFWGWEGRTYVSRTSPNITFPRRENVARTGTLANCETAGDMFCDTDPDYVSQRWSCPNTKQFTDPNGVVFTLKSDNYMSYSSDECQSKFSDLQIAHMVESMTTLRDRKDLLLLPQPNVSAMSPVTYFEPKTHTMRTSRNGLYIRFNKVENATKYHIVIAKGTTVLNNNFNITPASIKIDTIISDTSFLVPESIFTAVNDNNYYYWEMTPINKTFTCISNGVPMQNFRVSSNSITFNVKNESCFQQNDGEISISTNTGAIIDNALNGNTILPLPIRNLLPGSYFIDTKFSATDIVRSFFQIIAAKEIIPTFTQSGNTITANVTGGIPPYTYIWKNGKNTKSITGNPGESVDLIVADKNNCESGTYTAKFKSSAIQESDKYGFTITPQLLEKNQKLTINSKYVGNMDIQINSIDGKLIYQKSVESNHNLISLDWKAEIAGVYIVNISTKDFQREVKVIVK